ncbi:uncharacterized protein LOC131169285 [Hevea brasiliensis]|uniref:uncharacterized protein LOC131169285 n=1 Tax=Hevea brasiliensis TaxID=3981 RepID=UPI0025CBCA22|nr:uncharacterized protein LOC131169285 [Hevea brasiliensis]
MVLSWITHSLSTSIAQSILWIDSVAEVWKDLKDRFSQGDIFRISDLQEEIYGFTQGELSVTDYFTQLKILWNELENFRPIPSCTCVTRCSCDALVTVKVYRQNDYVIRFLKGLNEQYDHVKSQIMLMDPLPSINKVFSLVIQQERQLFPIILDSKILVSESATQGSNKSFSYERGFSDGRKRFSAQNNNKVCTYCGKLRHTEEICYRKHGFPPGFKFRNNSIANNVEADLDEKPVKTVTAGESKNSTAHVLTSEQYHPLMALIHQSPLNKDIHSTNQVKSSNSFNPGPGNSFVFSCSVLPNLWLLDIRATNHICFSISYFTTYKKIKPISVKLPDGNHLVSHFAGTVHFSSSLVLYNVLYIPQFKFNLISVSKLTSSLPCELIFRNDQCSIQNLNTSRKFGLAKVHGGLYALINPAQPSPNVMSFVNVFSATSVSIGFNL